MLLNLLPRESFTQAMIREAKEEAGIIITDKDIRVVHILNRKDPEDGEERVDVFFMADKWSGTTSIMEPNKCDDLRWFDMDRLPDKTIDKVRLALEAIRRKEFYSEYGWDR